MLTRCPRCETTFRVTPEQLKARRGRVRCGHCQNVFNALDTLIEAVPSPVTGEATQEPFEEVLAAPESGETAAPSEAGEPPHETEPVVPIAMAANDEVVSAPEPEPVEESAPSRTEEIAAPEPVEALTEPEPIEAPESIEAPDASGEPEAGLPPETSPPDGPLAAETPAFEPELHDTPPAKRTWPWAVAAAFAFIALLLQAALHFRTEISVLYPDAKPLLTATCAPFACDVPLPRKPELIGIETSNLSPEASGKLSLTATLKNRAPFPQQYPHLELTLTDTADQPLVRRVLAPAIYLPQTADAAAGFGAGTDLSINLVVEAPGAPAAGYQLYLFYP